MPVAGDMYTANETSLRIQEKNREKFIRLCKKNYIEFRVHNDEDDFAIAELKKEMLFADLPILGSEIFYRQPGEHEPNEYLQEILHDEGCPVILVPEKFDFPECNVLAYDGSKSSVYAIKQFASLFPFLASNKTILFYANSSSEKDLPDLIEIEELVSRHFPDLTISKLNFDGKKFMPLWLNTIEKPFLISGSFGRCLVSRKLVKSLSIGLIKEYHFPVFIAHK